jgi:hypothetical protein
MVEFLEMGDETFKYPEWQFPLQDLINEADRDKLIMKMHAVESLIFDRLHQLGNDDLDEREALHDAAAVLITIHREKLQFPK